jgi:hypothetical protein
LGNTEPLEYVEQPGPDTCKVVTFVPREHLDRVAGAMFEAGAGRIGDYSHCSYRLSGHGTFLGGSSTNPVVGQRGQLESVDEIRIETVVQMKDLPGVIAAMRSAHPYEEPAFDVYSLRSAPVRGIGRVGRFASPTTPSRLATKLKSATGAPSVQLVGAAELNLERGIVVAGSAGELPFRAGLGRGEVVVTGELRHHDALTIQRLDAAAVVLGHWTSERPVLAPLADRLRKLLAHVEFRVSVRDGEPLRTV